MKSLRRIGSSVARARLAQVGQRAAEVRLLGEHRERRRAAALVGAHDLGAAGALADRRPPRASGACARRSARCRGATAPRRTGGPRAAARPRARARTAGARACAARRASRVASTSSSSRTLMPRLRLHVALQHVARRRPSRSPPRRAARPSSSESRQAAHVDRGAGVQHRQRALGARLAARAPTRSDARRSRPACPRRRRASRGRLQPDAPRGSRRRRRCAPSSARPRASGPDTENSSRPSALDTTRAPLRAELPRARRPIVSSMPASRHADHLARGAGGIGQRAEEVEDRAHRQLLAHRHHVPHRRVVERGEHEAEARPRRCSSATRVRAPGRSARPSASSTSAEPHRLVAERLPCLATRQPAPAATNAAVVETLKVGRPPPVPAVSTRSSPRLHRHGQLAHGRAPAR